jgi:DNA helicase II / ATP-dependent DNA helicase PcrA
MLTSTVSIAREIEMATLNFDARTVKPAQEPEVISSARTWSDYQQKLFDFVQHGVGNAIVEAVAGSGKTTTIVEAIKRVLGSSLFLAFNKSIAVELGARGVNAKTFHGLCYSAVMKHKRQNNVEQNKLRKLVDMYMTGEDAQMYGAFATRLVGLARQVGIGCLVPDTEQAWMDIVVHHDIEPESEFADLGRGVELARKLLDASNESNMVDFDDMLYIAVKDGLSLPKFDWVFVDEAQDTNAIQRALLRKLMHSKTRLVAVGDPAQAIYGFRGADSESLNLIASEFNCVRLPLSITYRCPQDVVTYARQWVSHIEAAPSAAQGEVQSLGSKWDHTVFQPNDLVVCRTTRPVISLAYRLLRARVPVKIMGRDIGQGLKTLINKMKAFSLQELETKLDVWCEREVQKAAAKMEDAKAEAIQDKVSAIKCLMEDLDEEAGIHGLMQVIDSLFDESKKNATTLSTIHKAKGLEANTVFWLNSSQCPARWARQGWQMQQENNLCYVAVTRAKQKLVLIEEKEGA